MYKKLFCLVLSALTVLSFSGCNSEEKTKLTREGSTIETTEKIDVDETEFTTEAEETTGSVMVINPVSDITVEDAASELGLNEIFVPEGYAIESISKISGNMDIYSIWFEDFEKELEYDMRIAKPENYDSSISTDITGVYLNSDILITGGMVSDEEYDFTYIMEYDDSATKIYLTYPCENYIISLSDCNDTPMERLELQILYKTIVKGLLAYTNIK